MPTYESLAAFGRQWEKLNTELWSLTWAKDGRALFRYGNEVVSGQTHIVWEAIGTHSQVYDRR